MVKRELSASDDEDELLLKTESKPIPGFRHRGVCESKPSIAHVGLVPREAGGSSIELPVMKKIRVAKIPKPEKAVKSVRDHPTIPKYRHHPITCISDPSSELTTQRWTPEEDQIVVGMMEKLIKDNIWGLAKSDGGWSRGRVMGFSIML